MLGATTNCESVLHHTRGTTTYFRIDDALVALPRD
jgi:hypothetical protein